MAIIFALLLVALWMLAFVANDPIIAAATFLATVVAMLSLERLSD